jgi:hypothetical protein
MNRIIIAFVALFLFRCTPDELSLPELQSYIKDEEHGVHQVAEMNGTRIDVMYKPTDLWVQHEIEQEQSVTNARIDSLRKTYDGLIYFVLSFSRNNTEALHATNSMDQYSDLVQTLSFQMHEYVSLTTFNQDTIPVGDFMLNRTYGINNETEILFVFDKSKAIGEDWIQLNLNEFGLSTGNHRFKFFMKDLDRVPELKFDSRNSE